MTILDDQLDSAIIRNRFDLVQQYLKQGANPNNNEGRPLKSAARVGCSAIIDLLIRSGAEIDLPGITVTALDISAMYDQVDSIKCLLHHGAHTLALKGAVLNYAVLGLSYDSVVYLLENIRFSQAILDASLDLAIAKKDLVMIKQFVKYGAHVKEENIERVKNQNAIEILDYFTSLNETQRSILRATLDFAFQFISELPTCKARVYVLNLLTKSWLTKAETAQLKEYDLLDSVQQIRQIFIHAYPQNRATSYPYFDPPKDPNWIVYKNDDGIAAFERVGLLGLTAKNDKNTSVTKEAVVEYIHHLIEREISNQLKREEAATKIQYWYRNTQSKRVFFQLKAMTQFMLTHDWQNLKLPNLAALKIEQRVSEPKVNPKMDMNRPSSSARLFSPKSEPESRLPEAAEVNQRTSALPVSSQLPRTRI